MRSVLIAVLPEWASWGFVALVVARATISGLIVREGVFAWPMFSAMSMASFRMRDRNGAPHNQWDDLIHADIGMTRAGVELYLQFLREERVLAVDGTVTMFEDSGISVHDVRDSRAIWQASEPSNN